MNILFLYDSPLNPEAGGTERATKLVMDEMERRGHTCIGLLHFNQDNPDEYFLNGDRIASLMDFLNDNHVDVVVNQIAFHYWLLKEFLAHGGQEWKDKGGKIVSFMHFDPKPYRNPLSSYFRDWNEKNLVGKVKRLGLMLYLPYLNKNISKTANNSLRYIYNNSDYYIVMSPSYVEPITQRTHLANADKVRVITNMLTFRKIEDEGILEKKEKIVLVVARLDENQKRISTIIRAWQALKNHNGYTLHIVGSGQDEKYLKNIASTSDDIIFNAQQSPLIWYQRACIFMLASPREGWGLTLTESLQCGVVPIAMNTSEVFKDIIDDGITGYLANTKKEYIARLQQLINDDTLRIKMAKAGLKAASRFSAEFVGDKWEEMLDELQKNHTKTESANFAESLDNRFS
jgi:glycosyltransferase involved in cell wall biosynthesis